MRVTASAEPPPLAEAEFELGAPWFAAVAAAALPAGAAPLFLCAGTPAGGARVALPLLRFGDGRLAGLTTPYTTRFRPLAAPDATAAELHRAGRGFARFCRAAGTLRLDALDAGWPGLPPLLAGFGRGGMVPLRFAHFGNWHVRVAGMGWEAYLASRPGELRNTVRRRLARVARDPALGFEMVRDAARLDAAIAAYEAVYARSWKEPEPYPAFPAALMRAAAAAGALRLALLHRGATPLAVQIWTVADGIARVHKLAHDEAARDASPGTVLTALTIRHLLDAERVTMLDFGRGDDGYKAGWTGTRAQRIGVELCPPWQAAGALAIARHAAGRLASRFPRRRHSDKAVP